MIERTAGPRQADEWLRAAETAFGLGFWSWNVAEAKFACSPGLYSLLGVNAQSVQLDLGFIESLVHPQDRLVAEDANCLAIDDRQADRNFRVIRPDGQLRWLRSVARSYFDRSGAATKVVCAVMDVTDDHALRRRSGHLEALLHAVSQITGAALWIAASDGELLERFNDNARIALMGQEKAAPHWRTVIHPDDLARLPKAWKDAVKSGRSYRFHGRTLMADGQYRDLHVQGVPLNPAYSADPFWGGVSANDTRLFFAGGKEDDAATLLLTPGQVRACRALLDWTADVLARRAGVSISTIRRLESSELTAGQGDSMRLVMLAFREAGLKLWRGEDGRFCVSDIR